MPEIIALEEKALPENCFVYKHSTACNLSADAARIVKSTSPSMPLYWINVIEQRDLSNWVEEQYGLRHESPQLLKIVEGQVVEHWSHRAISEDCLS